MDTNSRNMEDRINIEHIARDLLFASRDAAIRAKDILLRIRRVGHSISYVEDTADEEPHDLSIHEQLSRTIGELELSVRSANCLRKAGITKIYQLVQLSQKELLMEKNFGRKSLNEIKDVLYDMGLSLGMDIASYIIRKELADG
jgi:DNA-directed RNA polymerase alpha subunit